MKWSRDGNTANEISVFMSIYYSILSEIWEISLKFAFQAPSRCGPSPPHQFSLYAYVMSFIDSRRPKA
jgi:hypothetical protein